MVKNEIENKNISKLVETEVKENFRAEFSGYLNDDPNRKYMDNAVRLQKCKQQKKIKFIYRNSIDGACNFIIKYFKDKYDINIDCQEVCGSQSEDYFANQVNGYDIIVYQVDRTECEPPNNNSMSPRNYNTSHQKKNEEIIRSDLSYLNFAKIIFWNKKTGVIFSKERLIQKETAQINEQSRVCIANTVITLIQDIETELSW